MNKDDIVKEIKNLEKRHLKRDIGLKPEGAEMRQAFISDWRVVNIDTGETVSKDLIIGGSQRNWNGVNLELRVSYKVTSIKEFEESYTDAKDHLKIV